jgi:DNA repair exonuclease SbcCD ATPase subunit
MASVAERVSVLETKVDNFNEKLDDVKGDITANHESLIKQLQDMQTASTTQHSELAGKIKDLQTLKDKWIKWGMVALAFMAGAGWIHATNIKELIKLLGL